MQKKIFLIVFLFILLARTSGLYAQEEQGGMPPALVVVSEISKGMMNPRAEFIGTVYYSEVSDVACEVNGKVDTVSFEEGDRVTKGAELVKLDSALLLSDLEKAELDYKRAESLYKEDLISEQSYDERRFAVERLKIELGKKTVTSPFDGVVIKKHVERGEWLSPGMTVATIADDSLMDVITDVPEEIARHCAIGMDAIVRAGSSEISGRVTAVIPRGDISTRTFPVKIQISASSGLMEGMEATVLLPLGEKREVLTVDRDAVINMFGNNVVFTVIDSKAMMMPVQVIGYEGSIAGIAAEGLAEGMQVVIKGNERLRQEQPVMIQE